MLWKLIEPDQIREHLLVSYFVLEKIGNFYNEIVIWVLLKRKMKIVYFNCEKYPPFTSDVFRLYAPTTIWLYLVKIKFIFNSFTTGR